jgi:hypothetical protein
MPIERDSEQAEREKAKRMLLFHAAARDGDTVTVRTLQLYSRRTVLDQHPGLSCAAHNGHVPVTDKLVAAHYNIDLQQKKAFSSRAPTLSHIRNEAVG